MENPIYFVTSCSYERTTNLASASVSSILVAEWNSAQRRHGWAVGRYVIMPDHVHFFCSPNGGGKSLSGFLGSWKEWTSKRIRVVLALKKRLWQEEFFDHLLRSEESYSQKWEYVRANPVRAGLVKDPESWRWQGEIQQLQF
jgi:putative transposase